MSDLISCFCFPIIFNGLGRKSHLLGPLKMKFNESLYIKKKIPSLLEANLKKSPFWFLGNLLKKLHPNDVLNTLWV